MTARRVSMLVLFPIVLAAQAPRDVAPLKYWSAPLYWQPTRSETSITARLELAGRATNPPATTPAGALVFVGMTPCRIADTRTGFGFTGPFGPPSLVANATRSFPIQTSTTCTIPSNAQAYSLNLTIVPPGPMYYLTIWPVGASQPNVSTLNDLLGTVIANAAIVPAGNDGSGSVNVFVSNNTDFIMDINGYYAPQTGLTLTQGTASAPSLSFAGDSGTGIYSSGAGVLNASVGGTPALLIGGGSAYLTAVGFDALVANTSGNENTALGAGALGSNTTGSQNTATGAGALFSNTTGSFNSADGTGALNSNTTGGSNAASGNGALSSNTIGSNNTADGQAALNNNTTGGNNTAVGQSALQNNTTGIQNTANGSVALQNNTTGNYNTALGSSALAANTTACCNTAVGTVALWDNTTGVSNTAMGQSSLQKNTTGNTNAALGMEALQSNTTGSGNIAVGYQAALNVAGGNSNNIHIGNLGASGDSSTTKIGTAQTSFYAAGIYGTIVSGVPVEVASTGQLGVAGVSSRRYKQDIGDMGDSSSGLFRLRPVTFRYKQPYADGSQPMEYGLIAEEVADVYPDLVVRNADGQVEAVQYQKLTPMLLNELQKQHQTIQEQAASAAQQQALVQQLEERLAAVEALVSATKASR